MPLEYRIEDELAIVEASGELELPEIEAEFAALVTLLPPSGNRRVLILDPGSRFDLPSHQLRQLTMQWREILGPAARIGVVVASDLHFGLGRMVEAFSEVTEIEVRVFRSQDQARVWLFAGPDPESEPHEPT
jgi:hypothetical protein